MRIKKRDFSTPSITIWVLDIFKLVTLKPSFPKQRGVLEEKAI